jgi:hypothetical protein
MKKYIFTIIYNIHIILLLYIIIEYSIFLLLYDNFIKK